GGKSNAGCKGSTAIKGIAISHGSQASITTSAMASPSEAATTTCSFRSPRAWRGAWSGSDSIAAPTTRTILTSQYTVAAPTRRTSPGGPCGMIGYSVGWTSCRSATAAADASTMVAPENSVRYKLAELPRYQECA